jgi:hypothetical protein
MAESLIPYASGSEALEWLSQSEQFDLVIACDNAIPHLLTDEELLVQPTAFSARSVPF